MYCNSLIYRGVLETSHVNLQLVQRGDYKSREGIWVSWCSCYFNRIADWLAAKAFEIGAPTWGWLRRGCLHGRQPVGWSDGTSSNSEGAGAWVLISSSRDSTDIVLEGLGGGHCPCADSMFAETYGFMCMTEGLRFRVADEEAPKYGGSFPENLWRLAYAKLLGSLRLPPVGPYARNREPENIVSNNFFRFEFMFSFDWNV